MKFLILQRREEPEVPVLFAGHISHVDIAEIFRADGFAVLSAGFVRFHGGGVVETHDRSVSLNLGPRPGDAMFIGAFYRTTLGSIGVPVTDPGRWSVLDTSPAEGARPLPASDSPSSVPPACHLCPSCPVGQG